MQHLEIIRKREDQRDKEQRDWQSAQRNTDLEREARFRQADLDREAARDAKKSADDATKDSVEWYRRRVLLAYASMVTVVAAIASAIAGYYIKR